MFTEPEPGLAGKCSGSPNSFLKMPPKFCIHQVGGGAVIDRSLDGSRAAQGSHAGPQWYDSSSIFIMIPW